MRQEDDENEIHVNVDEQIMELKSMAQVSESHVDANTNRDD